MTGNAFLCQLFTSNRIRAGQHGQNRFGTLVNGRRSGIAATLRHFDDIGILLQFGMRHQDISKFDTRHKQQAGHQKRSK